MELVNVFFVALHRWIIWSSWFSSIFLYWRSLWGRNKIRKGLWKNPLWHCSPTCLNTETCLFSDLKCGCGLQRQPRGLQYRFCYLVQKDHASDLQISFHFIVSQFYFWFSVKRFVSKLVAKRSVTSFIFSKGSWCTCQVCASLHHTSSAQNDPKFKVYFLVCTCSANCILICSFSQSEVSVQLGCPASVIYVWHVLFLHKSPLTKECDVCLIYFW